MSGPYYNAAYPAQFFASPASNQAAYIQALALANLCNYISVNGTLYGNTIAGLGNNNPTRAEYQNMTQTFTALANRCIGLGFPVLPGDGTRAFFDIDLLLGIAFASVEHVEWFKSMALRLSALATPAPIP